MVLKYPCGRKRRDVLDVSGDLQVSLDCRIRVLQKVCDSSCLERSVCKQYVDCWYCASKYP